MSEERKSSWDKLVEKSEYHFDTSTIDARWDTVIQLGRFVGEWKDEVDHIVNESKPANWETRGFKGSGVEVPKPELADEEYDLERVGIDPKVTITNLSWELTPTLKKMSELFGLEECMSRIHVQMPGQLWHLHIDKLYKWFPAHPEKVIRIFIALTDWQYGQFWEYGNYHYRGWKAGDITTFDWQNVPHCTANAGFHPRVTLQLTGILTDHTMKFLENLRLAEYSV